MILILGGTTEGRIAARTLEEAGKLFYYSTKGNGQEINLHHGLRVTGGLDRDSMAAFCRDRQIRLLVDAAHPFAEQLHRTVKEVADGLQLPAIRFERIYPPHTDTAITWCDNYDDAIARIRQAGVSALLFLTGAQSIRQLKQLWQQPTFHCYFRILDRDNSRVIAQREGFPDEHLCYYHAEEDEYSLMKRLFPDAILLKESGTSGGFPQKVEAAHRLGIRVFALRRPPIPTSFIKVNGPHGLRRMVERVLPVFFALRTGLTTGTCATAAAVAAVYARFGNPRTEVSVQLPNNEDIPIPVLSGEICTVYKDAGDDPDITNGTAVCASVERVANDPANGYQILVKGGKGVGTVTLLGLGLEVGDPAINAIPRRMITDNVLRTLQETGAQPGIYAVTISVPEGEALAMRTLNLRLGITRGISIIGTSGIVKPFSDEAFVQSIRKALQVAQAAGSLPIVINSGAKSEGFLRTRYSGLPPQAFVHYGNFIGETLRIAASLHIPRVVMGLMMGKAVKLAEGHLNTHSRHASLNAGFLARLAAQAGCPPETCDAVRQITLARRLWELLPPPQLLLFCRLLLEHCRTHCRSLFPDGELEILLISESGETIIG